MTRFEEMARSCGVIAALFIVLGLVGCLTHRETPACKKRNTDVDARVQVLEQALAKVPVGATKEDVVRFFAVVGMAPNFSQPWKDGTSYATGSELTKGCPPYIFCERFANHRLVTGGRTGEGCDSSQVTNLPLIGQPIG
jgi:hypothetical protein